MSLRFQNLSAGRSGKLRAVFGFGPTLLRVQSGLQERAYSHRLGLEAARKAVILNLASIKVPLVGLVGCHP